MVIAVLLAASTRAQPTSGPTTTPSMDELVKALREAGEPVTPADLRTWPKLPDDKNAAKVVWGLRDRMRRATPEGGLWGKALTKHGVDNYRLPLPPEDVESLRTALVPQQDVLALMDGLRELGGFDWGAPPSPYAIERTDFPEGAYWGACQHQLYLDGLLAIHDRDSNRAWRRVEVLRLLGEGMSTYPGRHDMGPLWPYLRQVSARLAADAAAWQVLAAEDRPAAEKLVSYWLDDEPVRLAAILHLQRERVAVIDAYQLLTAEQLTLKQLAPFGHDVSKLEAARIGVPMWPTVVAFYNGNIDALRAAESLSRDDSMRRARAFVESFAKGGFVPTHVLNSFGPWYASWHLSLCQLRATEKLAAAAIAVQLYRMDHGGGLPASLADLVPKYLPEVPLDSAAATPAPLRYRVAAADGAILWTTGKDGTDEDGKDRPPGVSRTDYRVKMDDVVRFGPAVP